MNIFAVPQGLSRLFGMRPTGEIKMKTETQVPLQAAETQVTVPTKKTYLKVKICSLAAEAAIIKRQERKWIKANGRRDHPVRMGLQRHRKHVVRPEARAAHLAYGYLRGLPFRSMEAKCHEYPRIDKVLELVLRYGPYKFGGWTSNSNKKIRDDVREELQKWMDA